MKKSQKKKFLKKPVMTCPSGNHNSYAFNIQIDSTNVLINFSSLKFISSFRSGVGISGTLQHLYYCKVR